MNANNYKLRLNLRIYDGKKNNDQLRFVITLIHFINAFINRE